MAKIIQDHELKRIIEYLASKPYIEVYQGIQLLQSLPEYKGLESNENKEG